MKNKKRTMVGAVGSVAFFTMISRVLALVREMELSSLFGTTGVTDAYLLSQSIPNTVFSVFAIGIATTFIPIYNEIRMKGGREKADKFTNNCSNIIFIITTILVVIFELFPNYILHIFASGLSPELMTIAVRFLRYSALSIYFIAFVNFFSSYLRIKGIYHATTIIGIPLNLSLMITYFLAYKFNIDWLAIGVVISSGLQFIVLIFYVIKSGFRPKFFIDFKDTGIKSMLILSVPIVISTGFDEINVIVDKNLASSLLVAGGISVLYYANVLITTCHTLISGSINTVVFPRISQDISQNRIDLAHDKFKKAVHLIELLIVPITLWIFFFGKQIIAVVYGRGKFTDESVELVALSLIFYAIALLASGIRNIILDVYYSKQNTVIPMITGIIGVVLNIILNYTFSSFIGLNGLALATSTATLISTFILGAMLYRVNFSTKITDYFGISFFKILFGAIISVLICMISYTAILKINTSVYMFIPAMSIGVFSYFVIMIILKDEELYGLVNNFFKAKRRKK